MHNGGAGWLSIEQSGGEWAAELWTVGEPKPVANISLAGRMLSFTRRLRLGEPQYPGGPPTGPQVMSDFVATVNGDAIRLELVLRRRRARSSTRANACPRCLPSRISPR